MYRVCFSVFKILIYTGFSEKNSQQVIATIETKTSFEESFDENYKKEYSLKKSGAHKTDPAIMILTKNSKNTLIINKKNSETQVKSNAVCTVLEKAYAIFKVNMH